MSKLKWMIVDITTGCFDGHYLRRGDAKMMADYWKELWPDRTFYLVEISEVLGKASVPKDRTLFHSARKHHVNQAS